MKKLTAYLTIRDQRGFIPMMLSILGFVALIIYLIYRQVAKMQ